MSYKIIGTELNQVPTNADLGTLAYIDPHDVSSDNDAYSGNMILRGPTIGTDKDGNGTNCIQSTNFGIASQTKNITIDFASGVYTTAQLHINGYSSAGQGAMQGVWVMGGHVANLTLFRIKEVDAYTTGNFSLGTPSISSGQVIFPVTHTGGNGGLVTVMLTSYEANRKIPEITIV